MSTAIVFPGQGSQFSGMGKDLFEQSQTAKNLFAKADEVLGFSLSQIMFEGSDEDLKQTKVTQPAVFVHSVIKYQVISPAQPQMVAGHSLGEFSSLVAAGAIKFEDALSLVYQRALAMQEACELNPSTMAAVLGLEDAVVENICNEITEEVVVAANYNCPGQLVISGSFKGVELAGVKLKEAGAKRVLPLQVGGAFHSPLMEPARIKLAAAIEGTAFNAPICWVYQNVDAKPTKDVSELKAKLIQQLTAPVRWTQIVRNMAADSATEMFECGPGTVLQGLAKKIEPSLTAGALQ